MASAVTALVFPALCLFQGQARPAIAAPARTRQPAASTPEPAPTPVPTEQRKFGQNAPPSEGPADVTQKRFVILAQTTGGGTGNPSTIDRACENVASMFACEVRWTSGATGRFTSDPGDLSVADFIEDLGAAPGVQWAVIGDKRFDSQSEGVRTTNVADASSTSTFAVETVFDPFDPTGACLAPCDRIPCKLGEDVIKVQHDAPHHLLKLSERDSAPGVNDRTLRFTSMGSGVDIYVVDGNIAENDEFNDIVHATTRLSEDAFRSEAAETNREFACSADHGTHVASLAAGTSYGIAKNATILPVSVQPGCGMSGRVSDLAQGLSWVAQRIVENKAKNPSVVTMSLQMPKNDPAALVVDSLIQELIELGAVVVAAAGNYRADACDFSPSGLPDVITVGALDSNLPWVDSNSGACVDVWAQGVAIIGASPACFRCTTAFTGTSQAAPIVTGLVAARLQSRPQDTVDDIRRWLLENAITLDNVPGNATYKAARMARNWAYF